MQLIVLMLKDVDHSLLLYAQMHLIRFRKKNMTKFCLICMCFSFFFVACSLRKKGLTAKYETLTKKLWISSCLAHIIQNTEKISSYFTLFSTRGCKNIGWWLDMVSRSHCLYVVLVIKPLPPV